MPGITSLTASSPPPNPNPPIQSSSMAILSLSQDITALISLSLEASASLVHHYLKHTLSSIGLSSSRAYPSVRSGTQEGGRGKAVVIVGASEQKGQSLTLHLAKVGYTVFPLIPLPSPSSPPTSAPLSNLLLTWSGMQKRLRSKNPSHSGAVVPVIIDSESDNWWKSDTHSPTNNRFRHAGETVRAYCKENSLTLVSIICTSRTRISSPTEGLTNEMALSSVDATPRALSPNLIKYRHPVIPISLDGLAGTDENTLISLYRLNILDPLSVIRELSDLLSEAEMNGKGRGRVIFVNDQNHSSHDSQTGRDAAGMMIAKARSEAGRILRVELREIGIDVCEVAVGPMVSPSPGIDASLSLYSQKTVGMYEGFEGDTTLVASVDDIDTNDFQRPIPPHSRSRNAILASRLAFLSRIWAVDDALLFSAVRRAIEDQYPRYRHNAGLSPLLESVMDVTPGGNLVRAVGRWVLGRLLTPRRNVI